MSKHLTLTDILHAQSERVREVMFEIPEWGGSVAIREMTAEARDAYEQSLFVMNEKGEFERNLENARAKLVASCVYGPDGKRMFKSEDHIKALGGMPASIVDRLFAKCQEVNAISDKDIEEIAGN